MNQDIVPLPHVILSAGRSRNNKILICQCADLQALQDKFKEFWSHLEATRNWETLLLQQKRTRDVAVGGGIRGIQTECPARSWSQRREFQCDIHVQHLSKALAAMFKLCCTNINFTRKPMDRQTSCVGSLPLGDNSIAFTHSKSPVKLDFILLSLLKTYSGFISMNQW